MVSHFFSFTFLVNFAFLQVLPKPELLVTQQNAHDEAIWSVSWAKSEEKHLGVLVTGSLDDTVKAWRWFVN